MDKISEDVTLGRDDKDLREEFVIKITVSITQMPLWAQNFWNTALVEEIESKICDYDDYHKLQNIEINPILTKMLLFSTNK